MYVPICSCSAKYMYWSSQPDKCVVLSGAGENIFTTFITLYGPLTIPTEN